MRLGEARGLAWLSWQGNSELKVLCFLLTVGLKGAVGYLPLEMNFLTQGRESPLPAVQFCAVLGLLGVLADRGRASKPFLSASPTSTPQEKSPVESARGLGSSPGLCPAQLWDTPPTQAELYLPLV